MDRYIKWSLNTIMNKWAVNIVCIVVLSFSLVVQFLIPAKLFDKSTINQEHDNNYSLSEIYGDPSHEDENKIKELDENQQNLIRFIFVISELCFSVINVVIFVGLLNQSSDDYRICNICGIKSVYLQVCSWAELVIFLIVIGILSSALLLVFTLQEKVMWILLIMVIEGVFSEVIYQFRLRRVLNVIY